MIPFSFVPGGIASSTFAYFRMSKESFGAILCFIGRKSTLVITVDDSTEILVKSNSGGGIEGLDLPDERFRMLPPPPENDGIFWRGILLIWEGGR